MNNSDRRLHINQYFREAYALFESSDYVKSLRLLDQVTHLHPMAWEAWYNKAIIYERLYQRDNAIDSYLKVVDIDPTNINASRSLGIHYYHEHKLSRARYWLEKVVRFGIVQCNVSAGDSGARFKLDLRDMHQECVRKQNRPQDIFISYSRNNINIVSDRLVPMLSKSDLGYFVDISRIPQNPSNHNVIWQIEQGIGQCDTIVVVWSESSSRSKWVHLELQAAVSMIKNIAIVIIDDTPLPLAIQSAIELNTIIAVYVNRGDQYDKLLSELDNHTSIVNQVIESNSKPLVHELRISNVSFEWIRLNGGILPNFSVGKYPVTQKQWYAIMGDNPSYYKGDDSRPIESVSWHEAMQFLGKFNKVAHLCKESRLLNNYEWEYACRASSLGNWCFGDNEQLLPEYAWYADNTGIGDTPKVGWFKVGGGPTTDPVRFDDYLSNSSPIMSNTSPYCTNSVFTKKPNDWGIYHMHGNVSEWVDDNVLGDTGAKHIRGGDYSCMSRSLRCSAIGRFPADHSSRDIGFRLCLPH